MSEEPIYAGEYSFLGGNKNNDKVHARVKREKALAEAAAKGTEPVVEEPVPEKPAKRNAPPSWKARA